MPDELVSYISQYGYLAIFLFVFLQEVGAPTPLPNELLLIFCGYLVFTGILNPIGMIFTIVCSDLLAAATLYIVFRFFGDFLLNSKSCRMLMLQQSIQKQSQKIVRLGFKGIVIGRLSPFIRGYVAVICGFLRINPQRYAIAMLATSVVWSLLYITTGYLLGPYWNYVNSHIENVRYLLIAIPVGIVVWMIVRFIIQQAGNRHATNSI